MFKNFFRMIIVCSLLLTVCISSVPVNAGFIDPSGYDVTVVSASGGKAPFFPGIAKDSSGNFYCVYYWSPAHLPTGNPWGVICMTKSTDNGATWETPEIIVDWNPDVDIRDPHINVLSNGDLVVNFFTSKYSVDPDYIDKSYFIKSSNSGQTWSIPVEVTGSTYQVCTCGPVIELDNGVLMIPLYGPPNKDGVDRVMVKKSTDGGATWGSEAIVAESSSVECSETSLAYVGNSTIYAMIRKSGQIYKSTDNGATWSFDFDTGMNDSNRTVCAPDFCKIDNNRIFTTWCRYFGQNYDRPVEGKMFYPNQGWSSSPTRLIYNTNISFGPDMGYSGSVLTNDNRLFTVLYDANRGILAGIYTNMADWSWKGQKIDLLGKYTAGQVTVSTDMTYTEGLYTKVSGALDGSTEYNHSAFKSNTSVPSYYTITLDKTYAISGLGICLKPGYIENADIYFSTDGTNWGDPVKSYVSACLPYVDYTSFVTPVDVRYVKVNITSADGWPGINEIELYTTTIPSSQMSATATSQQSNCEADKAIDCNTSTIWHNQWSPATSLPQSITLNLGGTYEVNKLRYLPRQDGGSNGIITQYNVYASDDGVNYTQVVSSGTWADNTAEKTVTFPPIRASYIKLEAIAGHGGYASAAEMNIEYTDGDEAILGNQVPAYSCNDLQYELGTKFRSIVPGSISKVRLYTDANEGGNHIIRIWRVSDNSCLAGPFTWSIVSGTAGWKEYTLPTVLNISANTDYIISISNSTDKYYTRNDNLFPIASGHLVAMNGVYTTTLGSMPTTPGDCYFRDIVFTPENGTIFKNQVPSYYCNDLQYELGTKFQTTVPGSITKVRLYTNASEGGNHTVRIWRVSDSTCLAGPYTWNITSGAAGWKEFTLPSALSISSGTDYIVSISNSSDKYYARHDTLFPVYNGLLVTYSSSGVYTTSLGAMPTNTNGGGCTYFRDVVFVP